MIPQQHRRKAAIGGISAAAIAAAALIVPNFEGTRFRVYRDVVGIPTYCTGETKNPNWNHVYTKAECNTILEGRLAEFDAGVRSCVTVDLPVNRETAYISLAYNIGIGAFCRSSVVRHENEGEPGAACDAMLAFDKAGGRVISGLQKRRKAEHALCVEEG